MDLYTFHSQQPFDPLISITLEAHFHNVFISKNLDPDQISSRLSLQMANKFVVFTKFDTLFQIDPIDQEMVGKLLILSSILAHITQISKSNTSLTRKTSLFNTRVSAQDVTSSLAYIFTSLSYTIPNWTYPIQLHTLSSQFPATTVPIYSFLYKFGILIMDSISPTTNNRSNTSLSSFIITIWTSIVDKLVDSWNKAEFIDGVWTRDCREFKDAMKMSVELI